MIKNKTKLYEKLDEKIFNYLDYKSLYNLSITCRKFRKLYATLPNDIYKDQTIINDYKEKKNMLNEKIKIFEGRKNISILQVENMNEELEYLFNNLNEMAEENDVENFASLDKINLLISKGVQPPNIAWYKICGLLIKCYKYESQSIKQNIKILALNLIILNLELPEFDTPGIYGNIMKLVLENLSIKCYIEEIGMIIEEWGLSRVLCVFEIFYEILNYLIIIYYDYFDKGIFKYFFKLLIFSKHSEIREIQYKSVKLILETFPSDLYINQIYKKTEIFKFILKYYGPKWPYLVSENIEKNEDVIKISNKILKNDDKLLIALFKSSILYNQLIQKELQDVYFAILFKKKFGILYKILERQNKYKKLYKAPLCQLRRKIDNSNLLINSLKLRGCVHKIILTLYENYKELEIVDFQDTENEEIIKLGSSHFSNKVREIFENFEDY
jgi:hypothetical protein